MQNSKKSIDLEKLERAQEQKLAELQNQKDIEALKVQQNIGYIKR